MSLTHELSRNVPLDPPKRALRIIDRFGDGLRIIVALLVAALFIAFSAGAKGPGPAHGVGLTLAAVVLWMAFHVIARLDAVGSRWDRAVVCLRFWTMTGLLFGGGITLAETVGAAAPSSWLCHGSHRGHCPPRRPGPSSRSAPLPVMSPDC